MNIGILETGHPPGKLAERWGTYADMFRRLLGPAFSFRIYDVRKGELPDGTDLDDALLITGSPSGVHDGEGWIESLIHFIRRTAGERPMLGVCFGHQAMAEALGGRVERSERGWGLGLHRYEVRSRAPFMDPSPHFSLPVSHQDQVVALGPEGRLLAGSDFTPFGLVDYPRLRAMSVQAHPEFEPEFARALIDCRRGVQFPATDADAAAATLKAPNDRRRFDVWMRRFLHTA